MENLTQKKLRELLKSRGLSPRGNKLELIHRMQHWEEHKTLPAKKEKRKMKRKSIEGGGKSHNAKRKKDGSNTTTTSSSSIINNKHIKREALSALALFFTNSAAMTLLTPVDKFTLKQVCKLWNNTNKECGVLGFSITTQFANAYLTNLKTVLTDPFVPVPTFILRAKPYNICFGVDTDTHDVACLILSDNTVIKALHGPKDDSGSPENDPLSSKFTDLKAYHLRVIQSLWGLVYAILLMVLDIAPSVSQSTLWSPEYYKLVQIMENRYNSELAQAKTRISEYMHKFDESNNYLLATARQIYQEILDVIASFQYTVADAEKAYTITDVRAEMERMLGFLASCQDRLQNDWLERIQSLIEYHISAHVTEYSRFAHRDLQDLKNSLARQLPGILHTPERVKEVLYANIQEMDTIALTLREQGRMLCKRSLPGKKTIRFTSNYSKPELRVKKEVPDSTVQYSQRQQRPPPDEQVTVVESSDLMHKLRLSINPLSGRYPLIDMQQAAQQLFMDLCRKYRELTTPDANDPKFGNYSLKGWQYFVEWLPQIVQRTLRVLDYGDSYNALYLITQLSMLLLKNECSWLRWSHYFEEEDTGDLEHKAICSIISSISEISARVMPTLRRDEMLRRWYSYTLRDIKVTNLTHLADEDSLMIEIESVCDTIEEITNDFVMTHNEVESTTPPPSSPSPQRSPSPPEIEGLEVKEPATPPLADSTAPATPVLTEEEADM